MKVTIEELQEYLFDHYSNGGIDQSLFMKLVEEIGEVAEVLNKKAGRKSTGKEDLQAQLGNELADVIHYAVAIAALNGNYNYVYGKRFGYGRYDRQSGHPAGSERNVRNPS